jgi:hypothetical protein
MSISGIGGIGAASGLYPAAGSSAGSKSSATSSAGQEFLEIVRQSPAERMRADILEELDITEEQIEALPDEEREAIEKVIAELTQTKIEELRKKIEDESEKKTGMIVDMSV